jgi:hypothetical protein
MMILVGGLLLIAVAAVLDSFFRIRMQRIGEKWALLQGGAFNYSRYQKVRKEHGWSAWAGLHNVGRRGLWHRVAYRGILFLLRHEPIAPRLSSDSDEKPIDCDICRNHCRNGMDRYSGSIFLTRSYRKASINL